MTRVGASTLVPTLAALLLSALPLRAQEREIREANLPHEFEQQLLRLYGADSTARFTGRASVRAGDEIRGDLAATGGPLRVDGRVGGSVAMLGGDVSLGPEASVAGDVVVVGGRALLADGARVEGQIVEFSAPALRTRYARGRVERRGGDRDENVRDERDRGGWSSSGWRRRVEGSRGSSAITVRTGPSYNRVEGLPLMFGPTIRTRGPHPLRLEGLAIFRTATAPTLGPDRWGYRGRIVQHLGWNDVFRFGGSVYSVVEPLDPWKLSDEEAALSTALFRADFRDHFGREGWSAFVGLRPHPALDVRVEYREAEHRSLAVASPWTLFGGSDPWRLQPLVGEGELGSVVGTAELDLRPDPEDPSEGWYARLRVERPVSGELARPGLLASVPEGGPLLVGDPLPGDLPRQELATDFTSVLLDIRHFAVVSQGPQLGFRIVGGGNVDETPLPPQFQHALGGPGSLPGFSAFAGDCRARIGAGVRSDVAFHPSYGCDRFVLGQVEYRGRLGLDLGFGEPDPDADDAGDRHHHWHDVDVEVDFDPRWMVFFDAGRGWRYDRAMPGASSTTGTLYDAGVGFLFDEVGLYLAMPLNEGVERDLRLFVRLQRRF